MNTLIGDFDTTQLQSYIDQIQKIKNIDVSNYAPNEQQAFSTLQLKAYGQILSDLDAKQAALLMSTQGLNTAQIQQTLATQGLTTTQQYQAMVEAGLLSNKKQLSNAELQNAIASATNSQSKAKEIMYSMGLSVATKGEEAQTVDLTAEKLNLATATGILTQAEVEQIAATTGVTLSQKTQNTQLTALTSKIKGFGNNIRNIGTGILALAKAHPAIAAVTTIITVATTALSIYKKKQEETATAISEGYEEAKSAIKEAQNTLNSITSVVNKNKDRFLELSNGVNEFSERVSLSGEEYEEYLTISQELAEIAPSLVYGYDNQTYIDNLDKVADGIYQNVKTSQDKIVILQQHFYTEKMALHTPQKSTRKAILCV